MTDQNLRNRAREKAKLGIRRRLQRSGLSIGRDPYVNQLVRSLDHAKIDTVLDIGANVGQFASMVRTAGFSGRIISIEPLASAHQQLARRAAQDDSWTSLNVAVGALPGKTEINISANSFSSSLLVMTPAHLDAAPTSVVVGTQEVEVVTVAELVAKFDIASERTLLKIDAQGFEKPVLDGAGALLDTFAAVQLELSFVELYEGQLLFDELVAEVNGHGLSIWSLDTGIAGPDGRLLQCDGLFMRGICAGKSQGRTP